MYLNIEVLGKTNQSPRRRKFSVSGGKGKQLMSALFITNFSFLVHRSSLVIEINVSTNLPEVICNYFIYLYSGISIV